MTIRCYNARRFGKPHDLVQTEAPMFKQSRRVFLQRSLGAAAACSVLPSLARADVNSKIRMATVGLNGRGKAHVEGFNAELIALCDCDSSVLGKSATDFEKKY